MQFELAINKETPAYSISSAATMLGVSVHTLRMYEREGLILPFKKDSKHRLYSQKDIERILCIRNAIGEMKFSISAIRTIYSLIPCWTIVNCPAKERETCEAYMGHSQPCWTYKHKDNICETIKCQQCEVYTKYSDCEQIKNGIKRITRN